jgi:hypothetical protein
MSTIYKIEMDVVSDWVKLSKEEVSTALINMINSQTNYVLRVSGTVKVNQHKQIQAPIIKLEEK